MQTQPLPLVAYFCMEYGLSEEFPIYAGGLGVLAGDYIKSAGDLRLPLVSVGLLWRGGYSHQRIGPDGSPIDQDDARDIAHLVKPTLKEISVRVDGREIPCQIWQVDRYGNAPLYLIEPSQEQDRWMTRRLYGGGEHERVAQEILLGAGGIKALQALGVEPDVYHFNEGHAVFAGLELIAERMAAGKSFDSAWADVRSRIVFTTHTPVEAGNESHPVDLLLRLGANRGLRAEELVRLGGDPFNMTVAGLRLACRANAVSELHGVTAREMWRHVGETAPILAITNGVHPGTWQDPRIRTALHGGDLLATHRELKAELLAEIDKRAGVRLKPDAMLVGFARRAAAYKRGDLILRDPSHVLPLLEAGKLALVFAGKSHPQDDAGRRLVADLVRSVRQLPKSATFLEDYDLRLGRLLTRGCDVWLNNPRRPLEASGTSGMKAAMNGVLNLSVLDGWWPEACRHGVNGWQIGDGRTEADVVKGDERDLASLVQTLQGDVLPAFEDPARWAKMMRASIESTQWAFSSHRMVRDYFYNLYRAGLPGQVAVG
ncbi:MAG TPA: alpha-glucan family phosphorylase [Myxococcales bacterium]|nr:alpha-glucan family phosphorylase [Myxococcales bacterium]